MNMSFHVGRAIFINPKASLISIYGKKLHEIIIETIKASPVAPMVAEIVAHIAKKESWKRPSDGKTPAATLVNSRVNNYRHLFKREKGKVTLVDQTAVVARLCKIVWNDGE